MFAISGLCTTESIPGRLATDDLLVRVSVLNIRSQTKHLPLPLGRTVETGDTTGRATAHQIYFKVRQHDWDGPYTPCGLTSAEQQEMRDAQ